MAPLEALHQDFRDRGFSVIGVESWSRLGPARLKLYEQYGITFPLLFGGPPAGYGAWATPSVSVIDRKGRVVAYRSGGDCNLSSARELLRVLLTESE